MPKIEGCSERCSSTYNSAWTTVKCGECIIYDTDDVVKTQNCFYSGKRGTKFMLPYVEPSFYESPLLLTMSKGKLWRLHFSKPGTPAVGVQSAIRECSAFKDIEVTGQVDEDANTLRIIARGYRCLGTTGSTVIMAEFDRDLINGVRIAMADLGGDSRDDIVLEVEHANGETSHRLFINESVQTFICGELPEN